LATLEELVKQIEARPDTVSFTLQNDQGERVYYSLIRRVSPLVLLEVGVTIYVKNRGTAEEEAYFLGSNPFPSPPPTAFREAVESLLDGKKKLEPEYEAFIIDLVNEEEKFAIGRAYVYDSAIDKSILKNWLVVLTDTELVFRLVE